MFLLQHALMGVMPVADSHLSWFWFAGSLIPDLDHIIVLIQHRIFTWGKMMDVMKYEEKYNLRLKTKYMHSLVGAVVVSLPIVLINRKGGMYFFVAYLIHLLMDWPDKDEKQFLYPLSVKFKGFLPIMSRWEFMFSAVLFFSLVVFYR